MAENTPDQIVLIDLFLPLQKWIMGIELFCQQPTRCSGSSDRGSRRVWFFYGPLARIVLDYGGRWVPHFPLLVWRKEPFL